MAQAPYYLPVRSTCDNANRLLSLLWLTDKPDLARPPLPSDVPGGVAHIRNFEDAVFSCSMEIASRLNIAGAFDAKLNAMSDILIQDVRVGVRYGIPSSPATDLIKAVYWGSSLRLTVRATVVGGSTEMNLGYLAAQAQSHHSRIEYSVSVHGHAAANPLIMAKVLRAMPISGTYDTVAHGSFINLSRSLVSDLTNYTPRDPSMVFGVEISYPLAPSTFDETQAKRYAMLQLAQEAPLADAVSRISAIRDVNRALLERVTRETYSAVGRDVGGTAQPSQAAEHARRWLYV